MTVVPAAAAAPADQEAWSAFYDQVEASARELAERMVHGDAFLESAWALHTPPDGEPPAGLAERHERVLGHLELLTRAAEARLAGLRQSLDVLPHQAGRPAGTREVGLALDVFG